MQSIAFGAEPPPGAMPLATRDPASNVNLVMSVRECIHPKPYSAYLLLRILGIYHALPATARYRRVVRFKVYPC